MAVASFIFSAVALGLSGAAFGWQLFSWFLTGGRVRVSLHQGAVGDSGIIAMPRITAEQMGQLRRQGYQDPALIVEVHNKGRMPVFVQQWGVEPGGVKYIPTGGFLHGPPVPHKLEAGERQLWAMHGWQVQHAIAGAQVVAGNDAIPPIEAQVTLASGKIVRARGKVDLRAALGQWDRGDSA